MRLARISDATVENSTGSWSKKRVDGLVNVCNPLDINPGSDDEVLCVAARAFCEDPGVDAVALSILPMTPALSIDLENQGLSGWRGQYCGNAKKTGQRNRHSAGLFRQCRQILRRFYPEAGGGRYPCLQVGRHRCFGIESLYRGASQFNEDQGKCRTVIFAGSAAQIFLKSFLPVYRCTAIFLSCSIFDHACQQ